MLDIKIVLLVVIKTEAKLLKSAKILWPGLSEIFFYSLHFQWWFKFLEKVPIFANVSSYKKQLIDKIQNFIKSNFGLSQGYKIVLTQNH